MPKKRHHTTLTGWIPVTKPLSRTPKNKQFIQTTQRRLARHGVETRVQTKHGQWILERWNCPYIE